LQNQELVRRAALEAVRKAAEVCRAVQSNLLDSSSMEKKDKSPVTVADFASQAVVCAILAKHLPEIGVVGEEDSEELRSDENTELRAEVVRRASKGLNQTLREAAVLDHIDRGNGDPCAERYWTLDPIDGTKGFLRGEQYAVALALIESGEVVFGALGCPNLDNHGKRGALFVASRGGEASVRDLWHANAVEDRVRVASITAASEARFCESVESGHSDQTESAEIAERLGITLEPYRIDSQCKYACVARDDASIYLRLPTRKDYREKIWDHAAGKLVVEAAGGRVTDVNGAALDFTRGRTLEENRGIVATCGSIHDEVLAAVDAVRSGSA